MGDTDKPQYAGRVRVRFMHATVLAPNEIETFIGEIIAGLPLPPDEVAVNLGGSGFVEFGEDEPLTPDELTGVVAWLRGHPFLTDVRLGAESDAEAG